jgi:hypothetical protein
LYPGSFSVHYPGIVCRLSFSALCLTPDPLSSPASDNSPKKDSSFSPISNRRPPFHLFSTFSQWMLNICSIYAEYMLYPTST